MLRIGSLDSPSPPPLINQMAQAGMRTGPRISVNPTIVPATHFWCFRSESGCAFAELITNIENTMRRARQDVLRACFL
jgi:hypothetical protein